MRSTKAVRSSSVATTDVNQQDSPCVLDSIVTLVHSHGGPNGVNATRRTNDLLDVISIVRTTPQDVATIRLESRPMNVMLHNLNDNMDPTCPHNCLLIAVVVQRKTSKSAECTELDGGIIWITLHRGNDGLNATQTRNGVLVVIIAHGKSLESVACFNLESWVVFVLPHVGYKMENIVNDADATNRLKHSFYRAGLVDRRGGIYRRVHRCQRRFSTV